MKDERLLLGYANFGDMLSSVFGMKAALATVTGAFLGTVTSAITEYVWDDARAIYVLIALLVLDAISGIAKAVKEHKFSVSKLPRILVNTVLYMGLLAMSWNLAKVSYLYYWIPGILYGGFVATLGISVFKNMYDLGFIPGYMYRTIMEKIGILQIFMFGKKFQEDKFKEASQTAPFGVFHVNPKGELIFVNETMRLIGGLTVVESTNNSVWLNMIAPEDIARVTHAWKMAFDNHYNFGCKYKLIRKDGTYVIVKSSASPVTDRDGNVTGFIGTIVDVTLNEPDFVI